MALLQPTLLDRLRRFSDVDYNLFDATPTSEDDARWKWANAFTTYATTMTPTVGTLAVAKAFHDTLRLALAFVPQPVTSDFAAAWKAGMNAMIGVAGGWDPLMLTAREAALRLTLKGYFAAPSSNTVVRLSDIADAFHTATVGMKSATNPPVVYG